ncbi:MAG: hypothetical protein DWQ35_00400 [Planctomycetota bacterium]|nr:MAG: hypothetical protein DWQ35_00400 [Planctomycetota bacterium]
MSQQPAAPPQITIALGGSVSEDGKMAIVHYQIGPTRLDVAIPVDQLPTVVKLLENIAAKARSMVLVPGSGNREVQ